MLFQLAGQNDVEASSFLLVIPLVADIAVVDGMIHTGAALLGMGNVEDDDEDISHAGGCSRASSSPPSTFSSFNLIPTFVPLILDLDPLTFA